MGSGMETKRERRTDPRYGAHFDVRFGRSIDAARALNAFSINFSAGGLCVKATGTHELGETLAVSLVIESRAFELEGVVAWIRGDAVGVRFINLPSETRMLLEEVARELATRMPEISEPVDLT